MKKKKEIPLPPTETEITSKHLGAVIASQMVLKQLSADSVILEQDLLRVMTTLQKWELDLSDKMGALDPEFKPIEWRKW